MTRQVTQAQKCIHFRKSLLKRFDALGFWDNSIRYDWTVFAPNAVCNTHRTKTKPFFEPSKQVSKGSFFNYFGKTRLVGGTGNVNDMQIFPGGPHVSPKFFPPGSFSS